MQTVDLIVANIDWLITVDSGRRIIRDAAIAVDGGKITAIGKTAEIAISHTGRKTLDGRGTVATPGFVDCHLHSSFQLSRGLADEANAQSFLFDRMYPYEAALDAEDVQLSATLAAAELLSTASPASSIPATIIRKRRSKASCRPAFALSCRVRLST